MVLLPLSVRGRSLVSALVAVVVVTVVPPVTAQVTPDDLAAAEAAADAANARLETALTQLDAAADLEARLAATLESLTVRQDAAGQASAAEAIAVRSRLARMYMSAGRPQALLTTVGDIGVFSTRLAYLGAVANRDLEAVNRFVLLIEDLSSLRRQAESELVELASEVAALELVAASHAAASNEATARVTDLREQWAEQEAARRAALEAETRRQEEELARQAAAVTTTTTTTAPAAGTTTTSTSPSGGFASDDGGYTYDPGRGVDQWRSLLTSVFARWGLDRERCGPNGCLGPHVEGALTIMWCESRGVPFAVNPSSGTTGLYQHRPIFWSDRVARTRAHPESAGLLPVDATPYNPAHNIEVAALLIWESRETLIGNMSLTGPWDDGPEPFGHWDGTSRYCADPPLVWP